MQLVIGNKNYSSWSLRPWLLLHANAIEFSEINESLHPQRVGKRLSQYSGSGKVPVLIDNDTAIWDSLAICEYISEQYLDGRGWPQEKHSRALARSVCAEMHAGFYAIRNQMPMNCRLTKKIELNAELRTEIDRIEEIWSTYTGPAEDGSYSLFGEFGIADCFFAPLALRFKSYGVVLTEKARRYQQSILSHPSLCAWVAQAGKETETLPQIEV